MQAIILAAGLGSRLGALTSALPKALIEVGGHALLDYALAFARKAGASRCIVVGGFYHDRVARRAASRGAVLVENRDFRKGNLLSYLAGCDALAPGGLLIMNTDHVYRPAIAAQVAETAARASDVTAFCDRDRALGPDDMKVALDSSGHVRLMAKDLARWQAGYVGMTFVPSGRVAAHVEAARRVRRRDGEKRHVESVLVELAAGGTPVVVNDVSGHGWLEIDEPHERAHADRVLRAEAWWPLEAGSHR
jgi:choline kinase